MNKISDDYDAQINKHEQEIISHKDRIMVIKRKRYIAEKKKELIESAPEMIELLAKIYYGIIKKPLNDPSLRKYYNASEFSTEILRKELTTIKPKQRKDNEE